MDDHPDTWLTLTEAATRTGYTREAIRARIRRGSLPATKGNDGQFRVQARDLADLPPADAAMDDHGQTESAATDAAMAVALSTAAGLRATTADLQTRLDAAMAGRLADHGRAERAEALATAEATRAATAEARLAAAEAALAEARTPWAVRVIKAWRRRGE